MKLTIYWKMMIGFGIMIILMIIVNAYVLVALYTVSGRMRHTLMIDARSIDFAKQLQTLLSDEDRYAQKYLISRDPAYYALFAETSRLFIQNLDSLSLDASPAGQPQEMVQNAERMHSWYATVITAQHAQGAQPPPEGSRNDTLETLRRTLDNLITIDQRAISSSIANVEAATERASDVALLVTGCALIAAITLAFAITRTITRPINVLMRGTESVAHGRFEHIKVSSNDEMARLAKAFNSMSESLTQLNNMKAEMMQHISHELRMPLQTMHSAYYLLSEQQAGPLNDRQLRLLSSMRENIDKIARFSNQFLDLSKIEAGMMEFTIARADVTPIVRSAVEDATVNATRKEINVQSTFEPVPEVLLDADKCSQIFTNLLSNAVKYTEPGGSIAVKVAPSVRGVKVSVADSGSGIAPAELPKIFTKFYRTPNAVKGKAKGTGLGLALVKALVEGQGGTIHAKSTPGMGSTFTVELRATKNGTP